MRVRRWLLLGVAFAAMVACTRPRERVNPTPVAQGQTVEGVLNSGGVERTYRLHLPRGYDGRAPLPLVVSLHGLSATAEDQERLSGFSEWADERGFLVVYPQSLSGGWRVPPGSADVTFLRDLVAHLEAGYAIDPARRYVAGISNGGGMANRAACDAADLFAAAASVAGAYLTWEQCAPSRPVPILAFHGLEDQMVPYEGNRALPSIPAWAAAWAERNGCREGPVMDRPQPGAERRRWTACQAGAEVVLYALEGVGHAWPGVGRAADSVEATALMWAFFEAHRMP